MTESRAVVNQTNTSILNSLKFTEGTVRYTIEETITVIEADGDECTTEKFSDVTNVVQIENADAEILRT